MKNLLITLGQAIIRSAQTHDPITCAALMQGASLIKRRMQARRSNLRAAR